MTVAVVGGTGFLGRHIVRALLDAGHQVRVVGRTPAKVERSPMLRGATAARGDITEPGSLPAALEGASVVVVAVQFPNHPIEVPRRGLTYDAYDRRGTMNLIAAAEQVGAERYVYLSGAGADPTREEPWYRAKGLAERALADSRLAYTVLRPSWAYGRGDRALNRFILAARLGPVVPRLGLEEQLIQPVAAEDIGRAVTRIVGRSETAGTTLEIGCRDVMTMQEVIETMLSVLGKRRAILPIPKALAKAATAPLVLLPRPPMTPAGIEFAVQDGIVDIGPMVAALGIEPMPLREGLSRYVAA